MFQPNNTPQEPQPENTDHIESAATPDSLEAELEKAKQKSEEHYKRLLRSVADYQNLKKQVETERADFAQYATSGLLLSLLDVLDDMERAITSVPETVSSLEWFKGLLLVRQNFWKQLEKEGLERFESVGKIFTPDLHEALLYQESEQVPQDHIINEAKPGYKLGEKVLRHAQVIVSKGKES
ncbi:MAG: nucleotide exchange factor GrpE [bacterium]